MTLALNANAQSHSEARASLSRALDAAEKRLRAIYVDRRFEARMLRARWLPDSSGYTVLEQPTKGDGGRELVRYDCVSGERTVLVSRDQLTQRGADKPLWIRDYVVSDGGVILLETDRPGKSGAARRGIDYWILHRDAGSLRKVVEDPVPGTLTCALSPDSRRVAFRQKWNIHVCDLETEQVTAMTANGTPDAIDNTFGNGRPWSPDGRYLAFIQTDLRPIRKRPVIDPTDPTYPEVRHVRFARVGTPIARTRLGIIDVQTGETRWIDVADDREHYLRWTRWLPSSRELIVEKRSRGRDAREFLIANIKTGKVACLYRESDPAWIDGSRGENTGLEFVRDGKAFVLLSEKDGWRHAYVIEKDGKHETLLTPGSIDITERLQVDEDRGWFYFRTSDGNATRRCLFRARLDGRGTPERVTPADQPGTHGYDLSPDSRWAFHTVSTFDTPPVISLVRLPDHQVLRVLETNDELRSRVEGTTQRPTEFFTLDIGDGVVMDAWMIKPSDFDPSKKYPVFVYVYGEPHSQTVLDDWSANHAMFHRVIADLGYLVVSIDNRGTPAPKGAAWRRAVFGSLGPLSTREQAAGLRELARIRPYVDLSRVGIWGWSGGGSNTLNALFREPDLYHVGIAVAPKPQPHLYNAWFQEIFMRTREENQEGYKRSAPINFAEGLKGDLLIVHGTGETNTHLQITEGLVDRLIELGKRFDYMAYPNRDHGIRRGKGTPVHLRSLIVRYLLTHLPPGPV